MYHFDYIYYLKKYKDLCDANINTHNKALKHWNNIIESQLRLRKKCPKLKVYL